MYKEKIRTSDIHTFIIETVEDKKCQYSRGLGYLCCHVYGHYSSEGERIHIINTMLSTYKSIYWKNNEELKFSVINSAATRIEQYCEPNR